MKAIFLLLISILFIQCQNQNIETSFIPLYELKYDFIYRTDREPDHELSKTKELHVFSMPHLIGNMDSFKFKNINSGLVHNHHYIGSTENTKFNDSYIFTTMKMSKLSYLKSYVYVGDPIEAGIHKRYKYIITGKIIDKEILMQNNLKIGQTKKYALNRLFNNSFVSKYRPQMYKADTLIIEDNWSIMQHKFVFKDEKLYSIEMYYLPEKRYLEYMNKQSN